VIPQLRVEFGPEESADSATAEPGANLVFPTVSDKRESDQRTAEWVSVDVAWRADSLRKAPRTIRGELIFADLFGTPRASAPIALPIQFGSTLEETSLRIHLILSGQPPPSGDSDSKFFVPSGVFYRWFVDTTLEDMLISFRVTSIVYQDGEREEFSRR